MKRNATRYRLSGRCASGFSVFLTHSDACLSANPKFMGKVQGIVCRSLAIHFIHAAGYYTIAHRIDQHLARQGLLVKDAEQSYLALPPRHCWLIPA